jgi:hypothetical protein
MGVGLFHRIYLDRYMALSPDAREELNRWMSVTAAARLNEEIAPEREALIQMVRDGIAEARRN